MSKGFLEVVVDGFFGSCGKGHLTAQLAARSKQPVLAIRVNGPNAGHVAIDSTGREWKLRQVPTPAVSDLDCALAIAAGSEIDPEVLDKEVAELDAAGFNVSGRLTVDPTATLITEAHKRAETDLVGRIGSTGKGIGAARADRAMRTASLAYDLDTPCKKADVAGRAAQHLQIGGRVIIEGTQGYGLGQHAGFYPHCSSGDFTAVDFLAAARINPWAHGLQPTVWVTLRPHPIRVAGPSGPLHGETGWGQLGLEPERTTVTNKIRRVGTWNPDLARAAVVANGGPAPNVKVALMQLDKACDSLYQVTSVADLDRPGLDGLVDWKTRVFTDTGAVVGVVGTSPNTVIWLD